VALEIRLAELVGTLSLATDAAIGFPDAHALRSATLAVRLAEASGAEPATASDAFYLALLALCGCTAESDVAAAVLGDEVSFGSHVPGIDFGRPAEMLPAVLRAARRDRGLFEGLAAMAGVLANLPRMTAVGRAHCEVAVHLAARFGFDEGFQSALFQMFERWDGSGHPRRLRAEAIARPTRIAQLAIDVDVGFGIGGLEGAIALSEKHAGRGLEPALVECFVAHAADICAALEHPSPWTAAMEAEPAPQRMARGEAVDEALRAIAHFADLKSRYTHDHSSGVAARVAMAGKRLGLDAATLKDATRAALVHDVGRVAVSAAIWDKREPLTDVEREKIRLHSYVGERILSRSPALAAVSALATLAHERLDGSGYHRRLPANACSVAARLLAAADVLQALLEERPHRAAFTLERAHAMLRELADEGALCREAVAALLDAPAEARTGQAPAGLTERELDVLRLVARGLTNKEVASALQISAKTVGHHLQHVFEKLGVTTRAAATMIALQRGLTGVD
jgi:HD-GYP domain-containing protein (c-di-GMP phosphodiesterase class II)